MDAKTSVKKKLQAAGKTFDVIAGKTAGSLKQLTYPLNKLKFYTQTYQAQNVSAVHLRLRLLYDTFIPESMKPKGTGKVIDHTARFIGRYLGCTLALTTYNIADWAVGKDLIKDFASNHLLGFLSANAPVPNAISGFLTTTGLAPYAPAIAAAIGVTAIMGAFRLYTGYSANRENTFAERKAALEEEIQDYCLQEGFGPSKKLDKLVRAYEKDFKADFSPQETRAIRDRLAAKESELNILRSVSPSQQESVKKIISTLVRQHAVPEYMALNASLNILAEMNGNTHAAMAKLKSHNISEEWINKFKFNPDSTVVGNQKKIKREEGLEPGT